MSHICSCWSETDESEFCATGFHYNFMNPSIAPLCKRGNSFIFTFRKTLDGVFMSRHKLWLPSMLTQIAAIVGNNLKSVLAWILMLVQLWFGLREHKCGPAPSYEWSQMKSIARVRTKDRQYLLPPQCIGICWNTLERIINLCHWTW